MSVFSRLGSLTKDIAGAAFATPKFIWDVVNAPWNDDEQFNGFSNTLKSASNKAIQSTAKPLLNVGETIIGAPGVRPLLEADYSASTKYLQRPLATVGLMSNAPASEGIVKPLVNFFQPSEWKKAYNATEEIPMGQIFGTGVLVKGKDFNIYDPAQRQAAFERNLFGKAISGTEDVFKQFTLDFLNVAGIAGKTLKASKYGIGEIATADQAAQAAEGAEGADGNQEK